MSKSPVALEIDGAVVEAQAGETVLEAAARAGIEIPTLCEDERLESVGCCRMCLVEIEGQRRLQPACTWKAEAGQKVITTSERVARHRKLLLAMYVADNPSIDAPVHPFAPTNQVQAYAERWTEGLRLDPVEAPRSERMDDNPYIHFNADACILCQRCVRYCDEVEAVNAITVAGRGSHATITTAAEIGLLESTCELCGGCIDTCPTGALLEKKPLSLMLSAEAPLEPEKVRTTCNFCGVGCQMDLHVAQDRVVKVTSPPPGETLNDGNLCVKGRFAYDFIHHEDRLTTPMIREHGKLRPASWDEAIAYAARGLAGVKARHGADALAFISSSRCTGEENYLMQKLSRAAFGTNNCHQCAAT